MPAGEEAPPGEEALARRHVVALVCVARAIRARCPGGSADVCWFLPSGAGSREGPLISTVNSLHSHFSWRPSQ